MGLDWNAERVLALAPDPAAAKAGQGLASARKWSNLGQSGPLIWGECQGSGQDPYQTKIDATDPAFSCSCPSRKFPCKHALGLMLVWASGPTSIAESAPPAWVESWRENRSKKAEARKEKAEKPASAPDPQAQAKRETARLEKVSAGLDDLDLWIADLARQGFTAVGTMPANVWSDRARRLVDAQAPGVARRLRQIDDLPRVGDEWQAALLDRLSGLHLLIEGFRRRDALPPPVVEDLRTTIGFPADFDGTRRRAGMRDQWQVLGHAFSLEERVLGRRTWLLGRATNRHALLLDFTAGAKPLDAGLPPGCVIDADLVFFDGSVPLRALIKERYGEPEALTAISGGGAIAGAFGAFGEALAKSPWLELLPVVLVDVVLCQSDERWWLRDASGATMPLRRTFDRGWHLLAISGGAALTIAGEFDGFGLDPLGSVVDGAFVSLVIPRNETAVSWLAPPPAVIPLLADAAASALVGVDRKPPPLPKDEPMARALAPLADRDAPARLLAVAAAASLYGRVGRTPAIDPSPQPAACPADPLDACPPAPAQRLRAILGGENADLLSEWLDLLAASNRHLPHDAIVAVLDHCVNQPIDDRSLSRVLGVRGRWLAAQNPRWRKMAGADEAADPVVVWETGSRNERVAALRSLRRADPAQARTMLAAGFAAESAGDRASFLAELSHGLTMDDEPFLEAALDDRGKEVRSGAAALLVRLPGSRLSERMVERARRCFTWRPGRAGRGEGTLIVEPPTECDKSMVRDGIRPKPAGAQTLGERAWWLREVVAAVPPASLSAMLGISPATILEAIRESDWQDALREAWFAAATVHPDPDWIEALLSVYPPEQERWGHNVAHDALFERLPRDRQEAIFRRFLGSSPTFGDSSQTAAHWVGLLSRPISVPIAREILDRVRRLVDAERTEFAAPESRVDGRSFTPDPDGFYSTYDDEAIVELIQALAGALPLELTDEAAAIGRPDQEAPVAYESAFAEMIDRLKYRRAMHGELAS